MSRIISRRIKCLFGLLAFTLLPAIAVCVYYYPWYSVELPETFEFDPITANLQASILRFQHECQVEVEQDSVFRTRLKVHFVRGDHKLLSFDAHPKTVFCCSGDILYFAEFQPSRTGCAIAAFNLSWGWRIWRTELEAVGNPDHLLYDNCVMLTLTERTLIVSGREAYGDYIEILDRRTGISMGHKVYRQGFLPYKEGGSPFIGGPIRQ